MSNNSSSLVSIRVLLHLVRNIVVNCFNYPKKKNKIRLCLLLAIQMGVEDLSNQDGKM